MKDFKTIGDLDFSDPKAPWLFETFSSYGLSLSKSEALNSSSLIFENSRWNEDVSESFESDFESFEVMLKMDLFTGLAATKEFIMVECSMPKVDCSAEGEKSNLLFFNGEAF